MDNPETQVSATQYTIEQLRTELQDMNNVKLRVELEYKTARANRMLEIGIAVTIAAVVLASLAVVSGIAERTMQVQKACISAGGSTSGDACFLVNLTVDNVSDEVR